MLKDLRLPDQPPRLHWTGVGFHHRGINEFPPFDLWQLHLYPYAATAVIGNQRYPISPGCVGLTPPRSPLRFDMPEDGHHLYAHFAIDGPPLVPAPCLIPVGAAFARLEEALRPLQGWLGVRPARAGIRLWDLLAQIQEVAVDGPGDVVTAACHHLEAHLADPVGVADLARRLGVSREHLARSFQRTLGTSVVSYRRQRRLARACHLLSTTDQSIGAIADAVGIPDPQAFNKVFRHHHGVAPREWRRQARGLNSVQE